MDTINIGKTMKKIIFSLLLIWLCSPVFGQLYSGPFKANGSNLPPGAVTQNYNRSVTLNAGLQVYGNAVVGNPGLESSGINIGGVTYNSTFKVTDISGTQYAQTILHRHSTTLGPLVIGARSNSDTSSHADVTLNQQLVTHYGSGWAGSNYKLFGAVQVQVDNAGTVSNTSAPGSVVFLTSANGGTTLSERMRISSGGNVGISTNSPGAKFDVFGLSGTRIIRAYGADTNGNADIDIHSNGASGSSRLFFSDSGGSLGSIVYQHSNDSLAFSSNGAVRMLIDSTGKVGIGTTAPNTSAILDVQSTTLGLRVPVMTTAEKNAIASPAAGLIVYDTNLAKLCIYTTAWETITSVP